MSDSDFSEVESDTQCEHQNNKYLSNANKKCEYTENSICSDSNGNNIVEEQPASDCKDNLSKVAEILRTVFESNSIHLTTAIEMCTEKEQSSEQSQNVFDENELNLHEDTLTTFSVEFNDEKIYEQTEYKSLDGPPPDVIQKSSSCESGFESNAEKPDILLDVSEENCNDIENDSAMLNVERDESNSNWSITPVDIVGNFEQEVEREFGLLVTGYKNCKLQNDCVSTEVDQFQSNEKLMKKVSNFNSF